MLPVFVISLADDSERRSLISKAMHELSIDFEFIDAIKGKCLTQEELSHLNLRFVESRENRKLAFGEIGCTLSHIKTYKLMLERGIEWCCILEDDIILDKRFGTFIERLQLNDLSGFENDILFLGGQNGTKASKYISRSIWNKKNISSEVFYKTVKSEKYLYRTCCYLVNKTVAAKLIKLVSNDFFLADEWRYFKKKDIISKFYLADFIKHPIDLVNSHIEKERAVSYATSKSVAPMKLLDWVKNIVNGNVFLLWLKDKFILFRTQVRRLYL
ncbi:glycosyltransferase family 25 protein [Klebsiella quasipneumoniae]|uniref:glycosyltransferase family 25 protein n=1 Tax=Klebsiella quasipneumoniae TaxID=1463165 RepID=UPI00265BA710|nr:glycosyltransferase family 25 protein [Klebsiella quasipneumoniae]MDO0740250.1 glycosyltransferase family 25 protein [Klebsiella quasipneumoniae]HEN5330535.1 glycosyltransferase family 25 protein [Klebsiella quasipneumoniae]